MSVRLHNSRDYPSFLSTELCRFLRSRQAHGIHVFPVRHGRSTIAKHPISLLPLRSPLRLRSKYH
ncbi:hypothetical protein IG631_01012 [Alternaria alternata]|nr:hypothetical protein IG631_01012 [Alternaria alternata]